MRVRGLWFGRPVVATVIVVTLVHAAVSVAATVDGTVREQAAPQDPIPNARVTLFDPSWTFFSETRTDAAGDFSFAAVAEGTYQLGASKRDFEYVEVTVNVGPGGATQDFVLGPETEPGRWDVIGTTAPEFLDATDIGILLSSGKIFYCHDTTDPILIDPATGDRTFPAGSPSEQGCQNATLLADGSVIMMGGQSPADPGNFTNAVRWVKTWDPQAQMWQLLADMQHAAGRWYPGLARLADGSLLVMGGGTCCSAVRTDTCERFDLDTQTWSYTGSLANPSEFSPAALLYTGEVLATWWPPQLYNPVSGKWRRTGNFNQPNRFWPGHSDHSLVVLADGRALAIGIVSGPGPTPNTVMGEIFDPPTETWSLTSNPQLVRFQTEVVQLPDGRIFVGGGQTEEDPPPVPDVLGIVTWCDLYDPATDAWRRVADMLRHREYHAVTLLAPDGRVVTTGGTRIQFQVGPTSADIEAYSPPYLLRGIRPQIAGLSATELPRGGALTIDLALETALTSVVLMGMQSTTHWVDGGIPRRLVLPVQQAGTTVTVTLPTDPNVLPLGHYLLFAMVDDVPSVAKIVTVVESPGIPVGACCNAGGGCTLTTQSDCESVPGQVYLGDDTSCAPGGACPVVCWQCVCLDGFTGSGEVATCVDGEFACASLCVGHTGVQSFNCVPGPCSETIPTVTTWGAMVLALLLLSAGTIVLAPPRRRVANSD